MNRKRQPLFRWTKDGFTLLIFRPSRLPESRHRHDIKLFDGGKLIFETWISVPLYTHEAKDGRHRLICDALGFLSLQDGDTDEEYFKDYTPDQIAWRDSPRCEELSLIQYDMEAER